MSGQPNKTRAQANEKRNEYMETLALQESINDMNLQANKTYLLTGQLPPSAQLQDTRTNAEKLADLEKMKQQIADELRPIAEPIFAYSIVERIMTHPLNADGGLFRFLAQRAASLTEQLKKIMTYGIAGDLNDLERIVSTIANMYSQQQSMFQSTKSYFNGLSSKGGVGRIIGSNDVDNIIYQLQDIVKILNIKKFDMPRNKIDPLIEKLVILKKSLLSTEELQRLMNESEKGIFLQDAAVNDQTALQLRDLFQFIDKLPKYESINSLIEKLKRYVEAGDARFTGQITDSIIKLFSQLYSPDFMPTMQAFFQLKERYRIPQGPIVRAQPPPPLPGIPPVPVGAPQPLGAVLPVGAAQPGALAVGARRARIAMIVNRLSPLEFEQVLTHLNDPNIRTREQLINSLAADRGYNLGDIGQELGQPMEGLGVKKRRGRPRGCGISPPPPPKIPNFVGFGINEINQKQLEKGIVKIRRSGSKSNYMDMPSKHVSKNLQSILKTIVGGGVPKYEELGKLDAEEKEYLHKLISRSSLGERLSVPAPSKDQQEKDIHNFEVMKGQILSGNDNKDLVRKFKLLMRKLSRQGLLPRAEVDDMIDTLTDIGH